MRSMYPTYHIRHGLELSLSTNGPDSFSEMDCASSKIVSACLLMASIESWNCGASLAQVGSWLIGADEQHPIQFSHMCFGGKIIKGW